MARSPKWQQRKRPSRYQSTHIPDLDGPRKIDVIEAGGHTWEVWRVPIEQLDAWLKLKGEDPGSSVPARPPYDTRYWPCVIFPGPLASPTQQRTDEEES